LSFRTIRYLDITELPLTVNFNFDKPVNVDFSEILFKEIKELLSNYPNLQNLREMFSSLNEEDFENEIDFKVFERDLRIYEFYGIGIEFFENGCLQYETYKN
jgi:hypothetical protein